MRQSDPIEEGRLDLWAQVQLAARYVADWPADIDNRDILKVLEMACSDYRLYELRIASRALGDTLRQAFADLGWRIAAVRMQAQEAPWEEADPEQLAETEVEAQKIREARLDALRRGGDSGQKSPGPEVTPKGPGPEEIKGTQRGLPTRPVDTTATGT
jgi:hypothetical protein